MPEKTQPWKAAWPPAEARSTTTDSSETAAAAVVDYGVAKGNVAVVDGTAANVKPSMRLQQSEKTQPWKASWPAEALVPAQSAAETTEYGVAQGDIAVVDGTAANVKPKKKTVRVVRG
ncbi:hypothetical protein F503_00370 [Ophiostoma piceae UAMH 11346]|uniref:Uncharacterized protein n=1 Tax=Ophiostoma piceae (strain UAMH 11346) TaxID=1262450 RepID=S3CMB1_OPHP1|nr:hypothetical protein F503_00370 [Ophiostoma piceae UAMH 11346]